MRIQTLLLTLILGMAMTVFTACAGGGGNSAEEEDAGPKAKVDVTQVEQYKTIGNKFTKKTSNGGQYLLVTAQLENLTDNEEVTFKPEDFAVQKTPPEDAAADFEPYAYGVAETMRPAYQQQFGIENKDKLLEAGFNAELVVQPGFTVEKHLIFEIPAKAEPANWELKYTPENSTVTFNAEDVEITDHRQEDKDERKRRRGFRRH